MSNDANGTPDPIDVHVGLRVKTRRKEVGLSQEQLSRHIGMTFQQVQKYEHGTNRISSSVLFKIACVLRVEVGYFFEGLSREGAPIERPEEVELGHADVIEFAKLRKRLPSEVVRWFLKGMGLYAGE